MGREYVFRDEWDIDAEIGVVFDLVSDVSSYPHWWRPVYKSVETNGVRGVGCVAQHCFRGALPYDIHLRTELTVYDPPHRFEFKAEGDLRGHGIWTFTEHDSRTRVCWDWHVCADKPLLRVLTPLLRPLFRWNHSWAVSRAQAGLQKYSRHPGTQRVPSMT